MNRQQRRAREKNRPVAPGPGPDAALAQALRLHQAGRLVEAEGLYRQILDADPEHPGALHLLGVLAHQTGHHAAAAELIGHAVARAPRDAEAHVNLGTVLHALGRLDEAEAVFRRAADLRPDYPQAHYNLGATSRAQGRLEEAAGAFRRAIDLKPDHVDAIANLGAVLQALEKPEAAVTWLERALQLCPGHPDILSNLAATWESLGRPHEAVGIYRQRLAAHPDHADSHYNLANALRALGETAGAEAHFRRALELDPGHPSARWNLGLLALERRGPSAEAWAAHAARLSAPAIQKSRRPPLPRWRGESLAARRLLVWREQGLGDELMFAALYPELVERAAAEGGHVVIECDPRLVSLFARSFPQATVRPETADAAGHETRSPDTDLHAAAGSLPRRLRPGLADFLQPQPAGKGWLVPDPERVARWRERLDALGPHPKVGIGWRSGLTTRRRAGSYTRLDGWEPILTVPGLAFVNLQYDRAEPALARAERRFGVTIHRWPDLDLRNDLEEAAALTAALDLVISAPTSVGELAGALGVPVWRFSPVGDWSTLGTGVRPWYPTLRLYQTRPGEGLDATLARIGADLARTLAG